MSNPFEEAVYVKAAEVGVYWTQERVGRPNEARAGFVAPALRQAWRA